MSYAEKKAFAEIIQSLTPTQIGKVVSLLREKCENAIVCSNETDLQIIVDFMSRKVYNEVIEFHKKQNQLIRIWQRS